MSKLLLIGLKNVKYIEKLKEHFYFILILLVISLIFFYPIFQGKIPFPGQLLIKKYAPYNSIDFSNFKYDLNTNNTIGDEVVTHTFPVKLFVIDSWKSFRIPFWNPYNLSGVPVLANLNTAVFYPFNIIFLSFPFLTAWTIYIISVPFLSSLFLYYLLTEFKISKLPAVLTGAAYSYFSFIVIWYKEINIGHTFLWLPLALFLIEKFLNQFRKKYLLYIILLLSTSLLAGYILGYFYLLVVLSIYYLYRLNQIKKLNKQSYLILVTLLLFPFLLALYLLLPAVELLSQSKFSFNDLKYFKEFFNPSISILIFFSFILLSFKLDLYLKKKYLSRRFLVSITIIIFIVLFNYFHKNIQFVETQLIYPQTSVANFLQKFSSIFRYWGFEDGYIEPNLQIIDQTYSTEGKGFIPINLYKDFLLLSENGKFLKSDPSLTLKLSNYKKSGDLADNIYRQKILNILGVRYILHNNDNLDLKYFEDTKIFPEENYKLLWEDKPWQVYENYKTLPRFLLTTDYFIADNKDQFANQLFNNEFDERKTIIISEDPKVDKVNLNRKEAKLIRYLPNEVVIETNTDKESLLFLSDTFYSGWKAKVDNEVVKIYKANYAFRAVKVTQGKHIVKFYYESNAFKYGLLLSSVFAGVLLIIYWVSPKRIKF